MRALITGATGLVGRRLAARLSDPVVLSRDTARAKLKLGPVAAHLWEPQIGPAPPAAFEGVEAIFNLAGEPVADARWSADKKRRIRDSRVVGTRNLVAALASLPKSARPPVLVSASAVGFYGDRGDEELDETSAPGDDFLAQVCVAWEREAEAAMDLGVRVVRLRIGIVLAAEGGALAKMLPPFKMGAGGRLGHGRQWMPWIHIDDLVGLMVHAAREDAMVGAVNATAPNPVTNRVFTKALGRAVRRPTLLPMPKLALRLAMGQMSEVLTGSQRALPRAAEAGGYVFQHPHLEGALASALAPSDTTSYQGVGT